MADSDLLLTYDDLMTEVGIFLFGKEYAELEDGTQWNDCDRSVQAGYRQFLYPPACGDIEAGHDWSFLKVTTTIATVADAGDQDMPDDFGSLIDGFSYPEDTQVPTVSAPVPEGHIRVLRQQSSESGYPRIAAIRPKAGTGAAGQNKEIMWYPTPDAAYTLSYRYHAYVGKLDEDNEYPLGGLIHTDTIRLSCIAAAEIRRNDDKGVHWDNFCEALEASIVRDKRDGPRFFGDIGPGSQYETEGSGSNRSYTLTAFGTVIES